jgi:hypothetical protein
LAHPADCKPFYKFPVFCILNPSTSIHDRAESIVLDQSIRRGDPAPRFDDGGQGMCRRERGVEAFSVTKTPLSFNSHAVKIRPPENGACRHLFAPRPCLPPPSFLQSCSAGEFDIASPQHVESPTLTVSSITSSDLQPSTVASPRSNPLKDLVDELPPFPFVRSTLSDIQKTEMRSVTYEDLLINAEEESPLRRRKVRGITYSGQYRASRGADACTLYFQSLSCF